MICLWMRQTYTAKTPPSDLRSSLSKIHYYHNERLQVKESQYLIPTYSWTLTLIPNWTYSVVTTSPFQCTAPSTWLTNSMCGSQYTAYSPTWERYWLQSSSVYHMMKIKKLLGHKTLWCTKHNNFFKRKMNLSKLYLQSQFAWTGLCFTLMQMCNHWWPLK